ncbi:hypothetical protein [Flagellimonas sp.]
MESFISQGVPNWNFFAIPLPGVIQATYLGGGISLIYGQSY